MPRSLAYGDLPENASPAKTVQSHCHVSNKKSMHTATKILTSDHIDGNAFGEDPSVLVSINSPSASSS